VRIAEALGVTPAAVSQWLTAAEGEDATALRSRSRRGQGARLSEVQVQILIAFLERGAEAFGFVGDLWTCSRIADLIEHYFGTRYHPGHVSRLLHRHDWTYQKPVLRAAQRDEAVISDWLTHRWPALRKAAKTEGRTIVFVDESGFSLSPSVVRTWSAMGQTPVVTALYHPEHLSVIGGLTLEGSLYVQIHDATIKAVGAIEFLRHLLRHLAGPLLVLWDGAKIHRGEALHEFRRLDTIDRLRIEYFPPYAPEVDPQEYVWHQLKHVDLRNLSSHSIDQLWSRLRTATRRLRHRVGLLRNLVRHAGLER